MKEIKDFKRLSPDLSGGDTAPLGNTAELWLRVSLLEKSGFTRESGKYYQFIAGGILHHWKNYLLQLKNPLDSISDFPTYQLSTGEVFDQDKREVTAIRRLVNDACAVNNSENPNNPGSSVRILSYAEKFYTWFGGKNIPSIFPLSSSINVELLDARITRNFQTKQPNRTIDILSAYLAEKEMYNEPKIQKGKPMTSFRGLSQLLNLE